MPPTFSELSDLEKREEWGKEYFIGTKLAQKADLYRAITSFKRAEILIPGYLKNRLHEIQYFILLSYFIGEKYDDVISSFEESDLIHVDPAFKGYRNLLVILHESFKQTNHLEKSQLILNLIEQDDQNLSHTLKVSYAISDYERTDLEHLSMNSALGKDTHEMIQSYDLAKKSEFKAQTLNALIPGAGYLYLGQTQSALTALILNSLTTYAAYHFFNHGNLAAGLLMTSIETGWYFGGITGAKESCKLYNERLYENRAQPLLQKHELHPTFNITHAF